jgi:ParB/RepB/Spo0J family partition protein
MTERKKETEPTPVPSSRTTVKTLDVVPGKNTRRGGKDDGTIEELALSIKANGLLNPPVLCRLAGGKWEVVAGHRRFAAVRMLGWESMEALAFDKLSETEALQIGIIENVQREQLPPVDEARAFGDLAKTGMPNKEISLRTGKSEGYVAARLSLLRITKEALAAVARGDLQIGAAEVLARIPIDEDRAKACGEILAEIRRGNAPTVEDVRDHVAEEYERSLASVPWDMKDPALRDAEGKLLPPCSGCPCNTDSQPDLFKDDSGRKARCQWGLCFAAKTKAFGSRAVDQAKTRGLPVLTKEKAVEALRHGSNYVKLDDPCYQHPKNITWRKVAREVYGPRGEMPITVAVDPETGRAFELVTKDVAEAIVKKTGIAEPRDRGGKALLAERRAQARKQKANKAVAVKALADVAAAGARYYSQASGPVVMLQALARFVVERASFDVARLVCKRRGIKVPVPKFGGAEFQKYLKREHEALEHPGRIGLMFETLAAAGVQSFADFKGKDLLDVMQALGLEWRKAPRPKEPKKAKGGKRPSRRPRRGAKKGGRK